MKSLYKRMSSCKCTFSAKALLYFATGFHSNSGGLDTSALNLVACSFRALFHDMGIPEERISNLMIAPLLKKIAKATNVVDMYDSSTWDGIDFEPVLDIVHRQIAPHANHQQRTESGVKGIADQSRTGVGEDRRNARSITHYYFTREHNKSAKELKLDVDRMQCAESTANYINSAKSLIERIEHA